MLSVADRGLLYGDGLFETIALTKGDIVLWSFHIERLIEGCQRLGIEPPEENQLFDEVKLVTQGVDQGVVKVIITRGCGGRGYRPPESAETTRIISLHPWPDYPPNWFTDGVTLRLCQMYLSSNVMLAGIKHLNRLEQVLARREWSATEVFEGIMLDESNRVIEATQSNLFLVEKGALFTADLSRCGVAGTVRRLVIEVAKKLGIKVTVGDLSLHQLKQADALFLTNSVIGLLPVKRFENNRYAPSLIPVELIKQINKQLLR